MINLGSFIQKTLEVLHFNQPLLLMDKYKMQELQQYAATNSRKRARICAHSDSEDLVHEMFIVHPKGAYIRPHKHIGKTESMLVLEGEVDFNIFDEQGNLEQRINMGCYKSGKIFFNSMRTDTYHSILIKSEWLFFLEITKGPFIPEETVFAPWSPEEDQIEEVSDFMRKILLDIRQ